MGRRILYLISILCITSTALLGCGAGVNVGAVPESIGDEVQPARSSVDAPGATDVESVMRRVFGWQSDVLGSPEPDWVQASFMIGAVSAYEATGDTSYLGAARRWADANKWRLGPRALHADDHAAAQVYLDLARLAGDTTGISSTLATLRALTEAEQSADRIWWWSDALFMAPPGLVRAAHVTGDPTFVDSLLGMWWDAADPIFDGEQRLFHRDAAARDGRDGNPPITQHGAPLFWSRANGWVIAGIARTLEYLPEDHNGRAVLSRVYTLVAERVVEFQGGDGLWRASLLDPWQAYPGETSGTALLCYAIAWGVNEGLLDQDVYGPAALHAWAGLVSSVDGDGRLGWVQGVGRQPGLASEAGTAPFGSGAFLLAGSEVLRMVTDEGTDAEGDAARDRETEVTP